MNVLCVPFCSVDLLPEHLDRLLPAFVHFFLNDDLRFLADSLGALSAVRFWSYFLSNPQCDTL